MIKMAKKKYERSIAIPKGVNVKVEDSQRVTVSGPKGNVSRGLHDPLIKYSLEDSKIKIVAEEGNKLEKAKVGTFCAHIRNMIQGVTQGHVYILKVKSGHFPMNITVSSNAVSVKNFLGEKVPRVYKLPKGVDVKIEGDTFTIQSADVELAGMVAGGIEQLTRITNRDRRVFQDGIYIISKSGKEL